MTSYVARRLARLVPVWLGITLLAFVLANIAPGDPVTVLLEQRTGQPATAQEVEALRERLGLDDPLPVQYARWVAEASTGDLGTSYRSGEPVLGELAGHFLVTLQLTVPALLGALLIAIPVGVISAARRNSAVDHAARVGALAGASMPSFWLAYLLILLVAVRWQLLPVAGHGSWRHVVLPALTLAIAGAAGLSRLTRSSMLEVLSEPHVATARAKGLPRRQVILRHGLRNALIPVVTLIGLRFGQLLGGAIVVEFVFAWPGIGTHIVAAIFNRDYPTIQGFVVFTGAVFVLVNLLVDLTYVRLDPRVRLAVEQVGRRGR